MTGLSLLLIIFGVCLAWLEVSHRLKPHSPLRLKTFDWEVSQTKFGLQAMGWLEINNPHPRMEVMVPEFEVKSTLLGKEGVNNIKIKTTITTFHPDEEARKDGYWQAYIVKSKKSTQIFVKLELEDNDSSEVISVGENIWVDIHWCNYGPFGRLNRQQGVVVPLKRPTPILPGKAYFQQYKECQVLPLKTHILGPLDDVIDIVTTYVEQLVQPGDVLAIGETPIAVMQGRYHHPSTIKPGLISRSLCRAFHPTSSLATACGLQTLINLVGPSRVIFAFLLGVGGKLLGIKGMFYRIAGEQARLIDDITGTTPPYDQTIVLGPKSPKRLCEKISAHLGIPVAIVDVNDLGKVKVLAASHNCEKAFLTKALRTNPAGNANEQTPLVLIRPYKKTAQFSEIDRLI